MYGLGIKHFKNLLSHLEEYGPVPRVHGNKHRLPHNTLPFQDVKHAVTFIQNYATRFDIPHPAALHGRDDMPPIFLPASGTYKSVHKEYVTSCTAANYRAAGRDIFCNIWHQCVPHIKFMSPRADVCDACEKCRRRVVEAVSEEEKLTASAALSDHVLFAQKEREFYYKKT